MQAHFLISPDSNHIILQIAAIVCSLSHPDLGRTGPTPHKVGESNPVPGLARWEGLRRNRNVVTTGAPLHFVLRDTVGGVLGSCASLRKGSNQTAFQAEETGGSRGDTPERQCLESPSRTSAGATERKDKELAHPAHTSTPPSRIRSSPARLGPESKSARNRAGQGHQPAPARGQLPETEGRSVGRRERGGEGAGTPPTPHPAQQPHG